MNTIKQKSRGFTLIESIVAVTLLAVAIVGPMTLSAQSIRATREARLELVATHLAGEGIEIVHNIRDNNSAKETDSVNRSDWMDGSTIQINIIQECSNGGFGCIVDVIEHPLVSGNSGGGSGVWTDEALVKCNGTCVDAIYQNPSTGLYRQHKSGLGAPWVRTPFTRIIHVTGVDSASNPLRQVKVVSTVTYETYGGATRTISANEDLYNWFPNLN